MNVHARRQPRVMDMHTFYVMGDQERPPASVEFAAVWEKFEGILDHAR